MVDFLDIGEKVLLGFVGSPVESYCFFAHGGVIKALPKQLKRTKKQRGIAESSNWNFQVS